MKLRHRNKRKIVDAIRHRHRTAKCFVIRNGVKMAVRYDLRREPTAAAEFEQRMERFRDMLKTADFSRTAP
jgi:hypothetical protein